MIISEKPKEYFIGTKSPISHATWPALSQRTERKIEQNKTLLIVQSKYSILSKFAEGSIKLFHPN